MRRTPRHGHLPRRGLGLRAHSGPFRARRKTLSAILVRSKSTSGNAGKEQLTDVAERFGSITDGEAHLYLDHGSGTVTAIDERGLMTLQLDGYEGPIEVEMYFGTRIPSDETAVRDAVGFIKFGDFKEQTEYGQVASEINKRIVHDVIARSPIRTSSAETSRSSAPWESEPSTWFRSISRPYRSFPSRSTSRPGADAGHRRPRLRRRPSRRTDQQGLSRHLGVPRRDYQRLPSEGQRAGRRKRGRQVDTDEDPGGCAATHQRALAPGR